MVDTDGLTTFHDDDLQRERDEAGYEWFLDNLRPCVVVDQHGDQWRVRIMRGSRQFGEATLHDTSEAAFDHAHDIGRIQRITVREG